MQNIVEKDVVSDPYFSEDSQKKKYEGCPFLGLEEDAGTRILFASPRARCHSSSKSQTLLQEYQTVYCLTPAHAECPLFQQVQNEFIVPLDTITQEQTKETPKRKKWIRRLPFIEGTFVVLLLGVLSVLGVMALNKSVTSADADQYNQINNDAALDDGTDEAQAGAVTTDSADGGANDNAAVSLPDDDPSSNVVVVKATNTAVPTHTSIPTETMTPTKAATKQTPHTATPKPTMTATELPSTATPTATATSLPTGTPLPTATDEPIVVDSPPVTQSEPTSSADVLPSATAVPTNPPPPAATPGNGGLNP